MDARTVRMLLACDPRIDDALRPCDPFVADEQPSKLRDIFAAGRAADGGLYVVDNGWYFEKPIDQRVFVSDGSALHRVLYDDSFGFHDGPWMYPVAQHDPPFTLVIAEGAGVRRMGLLLGELAAEPFAIGEVGEELEPVTEGAFAGRSVRNFVREVELEYIAETADGVTLAVIGPEPAEDYDHYRLFMGIEDLVEREVTSFGREQDGGTTTIDFVADGDAAVAYFPTPYSPELSPTLTIDGETVDMTEVDPTTLDGAAYYCR